MPRKEKLRRAGVKHQCGEDAVLAVTRLFDRATQMGAQTGITQETTWSLRPGRCRGECSSPLTKPSSRCSLARRWAARRGGVSGQPLEQQWTRLGYVTL